jgi:hypothetical protein
MRLCFHLLVSILLVPLLNLTSVSAQEIATISGVVTDADRHFFFGSYEGFLQKRLNQAASNVVVPNADLISLVPGDLGRFFKTFYIDRGVIPASGNPAGSFAPLSAAERGSVVAAGFPARLFDGDLGNGEAGTTQISVAPPNDIDQHAFLIRTDHQLTQKLAANVRYSFAQSLLTTGGALPLDTQLSRRRYQSAVAQLTYNLTPTQFLEARGGVTRNRFHRVNEGGVDLRLSALGVSDEFGVNVAVGPPFASFFSAGIFYAFIDNQTTPQVSVLHTWQRGRMTWRSGVDFRSLHTSHHPHYVVQPDIRRRSQRTERNQADIEAGAGDEDREQSRRIGEFTFAPDSHSGRARAALLA